MGLDSRMQYFIEQIFPIIWDRYLIPARITYLPEPTAVKFREISPELIELLSKAIWVQSKIAFHHWVKYLRKYYDRMISSPKLFVMYVTYACNTMGNNIIDHYERFVTVCSLLVGFGANFHYSGNGEVLKYIPRILAVFFERVLLAQFSDRGGWKRLGKYLSRQEYLSWHDETQIACPNETNSQKVARQLIFAKKVEAAISASKCKDYDADAISQKDVECDFTACKISDEVMYHFTESVSEKKGSKKMKSSATSQPIEDAEVEAHKKVVKGMMEIVQRARLDTIVKAKQLEDAASGVAFNIHPKTETLRMIECDSLDDKESVRKTKKNKRKSSKVNKNSCSSESKSLEKTNEEKMDPELRIDKPAITTHEFTDEANKLTALEDNAISNAIDKPANTTHEFTEDANKLTALEDNANKAFNNLKGFITQMTLELQKDSSKYGSSTSIENSSEKTNKQTSEVLEENYLFANLKSIEGTNQQTAANIRGASSGSVYEKSVYNNQMEVDSKAVGEKEFHDNQVTIEDISERTSVNQSDELASIVCPSTEVKDVQLVLKSKEENCVSNIKLPIEGDKQSSYLEDSKVSFNNSFDVPKTADNGDNNATSSRTSTNAKYKSKREAMNAVIKIVDNLAPKIEMFVVLLDSLVWDLKKDS